MPRTTTLTEKTKPTTIKIFERQLEESKKLRSIGGLSSFLRAALDDKDTYDRIVDKLTNLKNN